MGNLMMSHSMPENENPKLDRSDLDIASVQVGPFSYPGISERRNLEAI